MSHHTSLRRTSTLAHGIVVALALAASLLLVPTTSASAAPSSPPAERSAARNFHGSIALSVDGAYGFSFDKPSRRRAIQVAETKCRKRSDYRRSCTWVSYFRNQCSVVRARFNNAGFVVKVRVGFGLTRAKAARDLGSFPKSRRIATVCTTRRL